MPLSFLHRLLKLNIVIFVAISVALFGILTSLMSIFLRGRIVYDYLITGGFISLIVSGMGVYLVRQASRLSVDNENLRREIVRREKAEAALRESEAKFKELFENAADAIFIADMDSGIIVEANQAASRLMLLSHDKIVGLHQSQLHPTEKGTYSKETFAEHKDTAEQMMPAHPIEAIVLRSDGVEVPVEVLAAMVTFKGKKCLMGTFRDITERKLTEEESAERGAMVQQIMDTASVGIGLVDRRGRFTHANRRMGEMFGCTMEELIGSEYADHVHPSERETSRQNMFALLASTIPSVDLERRYLRKDGTEFWGHLACRRFHDAQGNDLGLIGVITDITERRLLEEERLKTQKLESIGTLAGGIAHDFNNLLQGIFGYIAIAKISLDRREKSLAMLEQAENALQQSVSLTTQLLTFSKGGMPVKKRISLPPVIENAAKFALSGSRSGYRLDIEPGLWQVDADEGQIGQAIQNIVINADQAMPGGGTVVIAAKTVPKPDNRHPRLPKGDYVEISVQDGGTGIDGQYLQKIFDPYFTTKEKGSGLGLATSYSIIRNHGGLIDVTSELGKGSTFFIYLPAIEAEKDIKETAAVSPVVRKGKILVMDDEALVRSIAEELIKAQGHEVDLAEHGEAAIEKYRSAKESGRPFDVVILDLTIRGGMGGRDTLERLSVIDPGIRAIVSSGYSDDAVVADYRKYGFKARLTKPYKLESLRDTLNALLSA
ncbi:MAG: PAS domain S-box protein [Nitrospiraceae bacterium]|nr:PAS domain S-box protein [Nitrospiraceae bacterium]